MIFRGKQLLAKMQPDPDVDPVPDGSNLIETENLAWNPYQGNTVSRSIDRATFGANQQINTSPNAGMSCNTAFAGAGGAADDIPGIGPLLRACGLSETINVGTDITYAPVSSGFEEIALYMRRLGLLYKALNCKGNLQMQLSAQQLPQFQFENFLGQYVRPTAQGTITPSLTGFTDPIAVSEANTPTFTIDGDVTPFSPLINAFSLNLGNTVEWFDEPNGKGSRITNRESSAQLTFLSPDFADKNVWPWFESHAGITFTDIAVVHGTATGNIVEVTLPKVQFTNPQEQESQGQLYYSVDVIVLPDSGNDELSLVFK